MSESIYKYCLHSIVYRVNAMKQQEVELVIDPIRTYVNRENPGLQYGPNTVVDVKQV